MSLCPRTRLSITSRDSTYKCISVNVRVCRYLKVPFTATDARTRDTLIRICISRQSSSQSANTITKIYSRASIVPRGDLFARAAVRSIKMIKATRRAKQIMIDVSVARKSIFARRRTSDVDNQSRFRNPRLSVFPRSPYRDVPPSQYRKSQIRASRKNVISYRTGSLCPTTV